MPKRRDSELYVIQLVNEHVERARSYLYPFHQQWFKNIVSGMGEKTQISQPKNRRYGEPLKPHPSLITYRSNGVGEKCRKLVGYLSRSVPEIEVVAGDVEDPIQVDMARGAQKWMQFHKSYDNFRRKRMKVILWTVYTGLGVLKAKYCPTSGPRMRQGDDVVVTGISESEVIPTFNLIYNTEARDEYEIKVIGDHSFVSFAKLESEIPGAVKQFKLTPEDAALDHSSTQYEYLINQLSGSGQISSGGLYNTLEGVVLAKVHIAPYTVDKDMIDGLNGYSGDQYWQDGVYAIVAVNQSKLIHCAPNELLELDGVNPMRDWNPYSLYPCYEYPHRMLPQGVPEPLASTVDRIDSVVATICQAQRDSSLPKWICPKGNGLQKGDFTNVNNVLFFNRMVGRPEAWTPPPMPAYLFSLLQMLEAKADRLSSQPPITRGDAPGQVRSGYGVGILADMAITEFTPILLNHAEGTSHHTRQVLLHQVMYSDNPALARWQNETGEWEQTMFFARALNPSFMVTYVPGSEQVVSEAEQMAKIDRLVAWGALMPGMNPQHAEVAGRAMNYKIPLFSPDNEKDAIRLARRHHAQLLMGDTNIVIQPVWQHVSMANETIRFMHSTRFENLAKVEPEMQSAFYQYLGKLFGMIQAKAMGALMPQSIPRAMPGMDPMATMNPMSQIVGGGAMQGGGGAGFQIPQQGSGASARPSPGTQRGFSRGKQNEVGAGKGSSGGES